MVFADSDGKRIQPLFKHSFFNSVRDDAIGSSKIIHFHSLVMVSSILFRIDWQIQNVKRGSGTARNQQRCSFFNRTFLKACWRNSLSLQRQLKRPLAPLSLFQK